MADIDINIESQIVVQTDAAWTSDTTVYSNKRLLVTSDVFYTALDQPRYKFANGVDTWSNLDYVPESAGGGTGTVTSVGLVTPSAFTVSASPVTTSGSLTFTGAGVAAEYVDGTGALQTLPIAPVDSVNGATGVVVLDTDDIAEGAVNEYYTEVKVSANTDVVANTAKLTNVSTDLSEGTATATTVNVDSSDGTNATLLAATSSRAGVLSSAKFDEIEANTLKVSDVNHNVSTDLSISSITSTTLDVSSSDGTDATIPSATTTEAGLMSAADKVVLDGITDTDDQTASEVAVTPVGNLASTDVQAALQELQGDIDALPGGHDAVTLNSGAVTQDSASLSGQEIELSLATSSTNGVMSSGDKTKLDAITGTNTGDQSSIVGISGTKAEFNTELTDGTFLYVGDVVSNVDTNLSIGTITSTTVDVDSSDGTNATIPAATTDDAGLLTAAKFDEIEQNTTDIAAIDTNTLTNITIVEAPTNVEVQSSDGTNDTIAAADSTNAGVMTKVMFDEHVLNNAKVSDVNHNVSTDLSEGTSTNTTVDVNSSDGTNATLLAASTSRAGVMTKAKFDEVEVNNAKVGIAPGQASDITANNAKVTNATHTGDVTGSEALTIGSKKVTLPMLADGTDGELITWDAAGVATTVPTGTATHVLTSNGAGAAPTFQAASGGGTDTVVIHYLHTSTNALADGADYFIGSGTTMGNTINSGAQVPVLGGRTLVAAAIQTYNGGTFGSSESSTVDIIWGTGAGTLTLSTAVKFDARHTFMEVTGLSQVIPSGQTVIRLTAATFATNPTAAKMSVLLTFE